MPSKETKVYHWAMRTSLRYSVTDIILSFNQCIVCDQEITIYKPSHVMMENVPCLNKSRNRLDKYHLLTYQWVTIVIVTVSGKEANAILNNLYQLYYPFLITQGVTLE